MPKNTTTTILTKSTHVSCDGSEGALGHPKIYLEISPHSDGTITCPYCSKKFVLQEKK